jgi:hypothetical protein
VSTEAPACITAPLETHQEPKALFLECPQEPSYVKILKDLCIQARNSRNYFPKKIRRSKQFYIRWQNIIPEGYEVLKKKEWKGLIGHQYNRESVVKFSSLVYFLHFTPQILSFLFHYLFLVNSN